MTDAGHRPSGRLVLADRVAVGRLTIEDGTIVAVELDEGSGADDAPLSRAGVRRRPRPRLAVATTRWATPPLSTGWPAHLLRRGVTAFLPTAVTAPLPSLVGFAERVRAWLPGAPADGAEPLGFNLEGPFLADARRGAHDPTHLRAPADVAARRAGAARRRAPGA